MDRLAFSLLPPRSEAKPDACQARSGSKGLPSHRQPTAKGRVQLGSQRASPTSELPSPSCNLKRPLGCATLGEIQRAAAKPGKPSSNLGPPHQGWASSEPPSKTKER